MSPLELTPQGQGHTGCAWLPVAFPAHQGWGPQGAGECGMRAGLAQAHLSSVAGCCSRCSCLPSAGLLSLSQRVSCDSATALGQTGKPFVELLYFFFPPFPFEWCQKLAALLWITGLAAGGMD